MWALAIAGLWALSSFLSYGMMCADYDYKAEREWPHIYDAGHARESMIFLAGLSLLPANCISALICTRLAEHGFRLNIRPSSLHGGPER